MTDAFLYNHNHRTSDEKASIAFITAGGIRTTLSQGRKYRSVQNLRSRERGDTLKQLHAKLSILPFSPHTAISYGDVKTLLPFDNTIDSFDLNGQEIIDAFEYSVRHLHTRHGRVKNILQVSGEITFFSCSKSNLVG